METTACALCGSQATRPFLELPDYYLDRPHVLAHLVQCTQCGLIYQNPRPSLAEMGAHYPADYGPYLSSAERPNPILQRAYDYGLWKRRRYVTRHKPGGTLLDIGCATGEVLRGFRNMGTWEVYGVEINPDVAEIARSQHGLNVFAGALEEAAYPDKHFDAITMWDVFEHLHVPNAALQEINRVLKDDGLLVIRVPNAASWEARLFGRYWAGLDAPRHLTIFTPDTLSRMLAQNGFRVQAHSSGIGSYMVFVLSVQFWLTARRVAPAARQRWLRGLRHPAARLASAPFFYLPAQRLKGSLLVTTARKAAPEPRGLSTPTPAAPSLQTHPE